MIKLLWISLCFCCLFVETNAQYFGRNKPKYEQFSFDVARTKHFSIYHYFDNQKVVDKLATSAESWYYMHQQILADTLLPHNPILLYRDHADFQQTNAITSAPGVGTGGVTEALKNRVIMPVTESNYQTDHVLGHELVHAFQYDMILHNEDSSLSVRNLANIPLWMIEGMAEYLSLGSKDPHTAMWMRDAVINDDIPTIKDLTTTNKYFPYRYGQAFWAFVANTWGDSVVRPLFLETARLGYEEGIQKVFNFDHETLSELWKQSMKKYYLQFEENNSGPLIGHRILSEENAGRVNISPAISPNGSYVAFLSEKDLFSIDLFLADARTGEIIRKLTTTAQASHVDALSFLESSGAWSADSRRFAYVVFDKGMNKIVITDAATGRTLEEIEVPGVPALSNLTWSPDGEKIAFTGLVDGHSDIYVYHLKSGKADQVTDDRFSDLQPYWFNDSEHIVFVTDRVRPSDDKDYGSYRLALLNTQSKNVEVLDVFPGADNYNPVVAPDGESVYFISNRDGFRNLYRYHIPEKSTFQLTRYFTGISGITASAPALSIAREENLLAYVYYNGGEYSIFSAPLENFIEEEVDAQVVNMLPGYLPPYIPGRTTDVDENIAQRFELRENLSIAPEEVPYRPKFKLDYLSSSGAGISTSRFGTGVAGGVNAIFSDILGDKQLYATAALNGEVYDFGGQLVYFNREKRLQWAVSASHIPYRYGWYDIQPDTLIIEGDSLNVANLALNIRRIFEKQVGAYLFYPISTTKRLELEGSHAWYSMRQDRYNNYYYEGFFIGEDRDRDLPTPDGYTLQRVSGALVSDNSYFGLTAPLAGHRYRLQAEQYFGRLDLSSTLVDYRRYFFIRPFSLAFRGYYYARYGTDASSGLLAPLFLGYPGFIRGYSTTTFYDSENSVNINDLLGSKMFIGNVELRLPFSGPVDLALIRSNIFFTDLNLFLDGGVAWDRQDSVQFGESTTMESDVTPIFSTGVSLRVNLFGALVVEPYYAIPLNRESFRGEFGINFLPGW